MTAEPAAKAAEPELPKPNPRKIAPGSPAPAAKGAEPAPAVKIPTALPEAARQPMPEGQWAAFWSDRRAAVLLSAFHNVQADVIGDERLRPGSGTVQIMGPALGATMRAIPVGDQATGIVKMVADRWVLIALGLLLALEVGRILLALRRQRAKALAERQLEPAAESDAPSPGRPAYTLVGDGRTMGSG